MPRTEEYYCKIPWVFKKIVDGLLAAELFIYVDNGRTIRYTKTLYWKAPRRWGSACSSLGIQDASKKVQPPSQALGPWAGTVTNIKGGGHGLVYQEIWDKTWRLIAELVRMEQEGRYGMPISRMESIIGFFIYGSSTHMDINPYLKGVNLTLDSWRPYSYEEGLRLRGK